MTLKKLIPHRPTRLVVATLIMCFLMVGVDFCVWYVADVTSSKYVNVAFTAIFLLIMGKSLWKIQQAGILEKMTIGQIVVSYFIGTTTTALIISFLMVIPVLIFPNWFGWVVLTIVLACIGKAAERRAAVR